MCIQGLGGAAPNVDLVAYYDARTKDYDGSYSKPGRMPDLEIVGEQIVDLVAGRRVLEIACGTGFWTERLARGAESVLATDINESVLRLARTRLLRTRNVELLAADAYRLDNVRAHCDAAVATFWWSHIPASRIDEFLDTLESRLSPDAVVVFMDNRYVPGDNRPITRTDFEGNTFQLRRLQDGSQWEVLKNFPTTGEISSVLSDRGSDLQILSLTHFWLATYRVKRPDPEGVVASMDDPHG
ncbi:MAG: class I SAM-dependent methyltransferase [Gemmatimonadetes bacterium]|nr:class I SAM-dependent methyltransferase [Gemmatimonadota bacterium]